MMVDTQVRPSDVTKFPIIDAMLSVPRELFVPREQVEAAYVSENGAKVRKALTEDHGVTFCELKDAEVWAEKAQGAWPQLYELVGGGEDWVKMTVKYRDTGAF